MRCGLTLRLRLPPQAKNGYNGNAIYGIRLFMDLILQILSVLFVVFWTARLAAKKRRNPLVWAGAAALPAVAVYLISALPDALTILCMAPMLGLVFVPAHQPVPTDGEPDTTVHCPRCQQAHEPGTTFCTNCGWELSRQYAAPDVNADTAETPDPVMASSTETVAEPPVAAETTAAPDPAPAADSTRATEPTLAADPVLASEQNTASGQEAQPAFTAEPMKITRPLTASGMTDAGLALVNQGRIREAVDQFTKAIALDPRYRDAWINRAKAYDQLGLRDKAAADQQQLEAI